MKLDFNRKYTTIAVYAFLVIGAGVLFNVLVSNFALIFGYILKFLALFMPFIYGYCIAYLLNPIMKFFERLYLRIDKKNKLLKFKRSICLTTTLIVVAAVLTFFIWVISPQIKESVVTLTKKFQTWLPNAQSWISRFFDDANLTHVLEEQITKFTNFVTDFAMNYSGNSISNIWGGVLNVTTAISNIVIGVIISVYMLLDKEKFLSQLKKVSKVVMGNKFTERITALLYDADKIFSGFIVGKILDSLIIGIICSVGMRIFKMQFAPLIGFIVGLTNIIPYFGACIGAIVGALILLVVSPIQSFWFLIFVIILQQIDGNVLGPKILGTSTGISAFWVMFAIVIGGGLFGIMGMLVGVPAFALIYALARSFINRKADEQH